MLLIQGARSFIQAAERKCGPANSWVKRLVRHRNGKEAAVAFANKNARIVRAFSKDAQYFFRLERFSVWCSEADTSVDKIVGRPSFADEDVGKGFPTLYLDSASDKRQNLRLIIGQKTLGKTFPTLGVKPAL